MTEQSANRRRVGRHGARRYREMRLQETGMYGLQGKRWYRVDDALCLKETEGVFVSQEKSDERGLVLRWRKI